MNYKDAWYELKQILELENFKIWKSVDYKTEDKELMRFKGKHEGIEVALDFMEEVDNNLTD